MSDVNERDRYGYTKLHRASEDGDYEEVRRLVEGGADVNIRDNAGWTAVMNACQGHRDMGHGSVSSSTRCRP